MKTPYLLLILAIIVICAVLNQKKKQPIATTAPLQMSTGGSYEGYTTTPNKLLTTDANGNLSVLPVSSILPTSFFDYYNPFGGDVAKPQLGNIYNISSPDKADLTLSSQKNVLLLPGAGNGAVVVSKLFGGTGNLKVEGNITGDKDITLAGNFGNLGGIWTSGDVMFNNQSVSLINTLASLRNDINSLRDTVNKRTWTNTRGDRFTFQDDGNAVMYRSDGNVRWSSGTNY